MIRDRMFWRVLLPTASIAAVAVVIVAAAPPLGLAVALFLLLTLAAVWHASWVSKGVRETLSSLVERVELSPEEEANSIRGSRLAREHPRLAGRFEQAQSRLSERVRLLESQASDRAESAELLQAVLRTMVEGVVVVDRDERVLFVNEAARSLMDFVTREVLSRPLWEVSRSPVLRASLEEVLEQGQQVQSEIVIPRTKAVLAMTAAPLPRVPVPGAVLVLHDVTELRRLETLRRDFVANVSHELKTPLTSIQAYADTLLEGGTDDPELTTQFLTKIVTESERLHQIILDVIRLGRIESQPERSCAEPVPVAAVVADCLDAHAAVAESRALKLTPEAPQHAFAVLADTDELRTILDNLVGNALTYTPAGGTVQVRWYARGEFGVIEVQDDGMGIPREQQARVFERFFRVDRARDRERGGTGLGLAIVKHLCQLFGGSVEVDSEMGRGSLFRVRLPLAPGSDTSDASITGIKTLAPSRKDGSA